MEQDRSFLVKEYLELWNEHGVDISHLEKALVSPTSTHSHSTQNPAPPVTAPKQFNSLSAIQDWLGDCQRCGLCKTRNKIVFGSGSDKAKLMFVGEGPGANEDRQGLPFVGRAGNLLTKIIEAMGYKRQDVYIANVVKCRPPENRNPLPEEVEACGPFLKAQVDFIKPQVIVALGLPAASLLLDVNTSMSKLRGKYHPLHWDKERLVMPTYHPAYLLRNPSAKRFVWNDMKLVKAKLESLH